jgi:hypothetical protein
MDEYIIKEVVVAQSFLMGIYKLLYDLNNLQSAIYL